MTPVLLAYLLPALLITILPGPDMFSVLSATLGRGRTCGLRAVGGVTAGMLVWAAAAGVGLIGLLHAGGTVYEVFRWVAVSYLVYLAVSSWRTARRRLADDAVDDAPGRGPGFRRGLTTSMLNPKLGAYFLAVLPQFVPADSAHPGLLSFALVVEQAVLAAGVYLVIVVAADRFRAWLSRATVRRGMDRFGALVFGAFALRLATQ